MAQVRVAVDGRDGEQAQALVGVGQALQGVGEHLAQALVDPGGARDTAGRR